MLDACKLTTSPDFRNWKILRNIPKDQESFLGKRQQTIIKAVYGTSVMY